jgi:hypothetical protein
MERVSYYLILLILRQYLCCGMEAEFVAVTAL